MEKRVEKVVVVASCVRVRTDKSARRPFGRLYELACTSLIPASGRQVTFLWTARFDLGKPHGMLAAGMTREIRYRQRFQNYDRAFSFLERVVNIRPRSEVERAALIQAFEVAFELSWKLLKDYLESKGYDVRAPRDVIKQSFQIELIERGDVWLKALDDRNRTAHLYDEAASMRIDAAIQDEYFPLLKSVHAAFSSLCHGSATD